MPTTVARLRIAALVLAVCAAPLAFAQQVSGGSHTTRPVITQKIDQGALVALSGHVLKALHPSQDLGLVEDASPVQLFLNLQRTPAQQADLAALLSEQQNPASANYHKWLTPEQFGERFGAAQADLSKITLWLTSQGFQVVSVAKNASVVNFRGTAGGVRSTFHAQLHYWNVEGGKSIATATEPEIPLALANVVSGIVGLNQLPMHAHHTPFHGEKYDAETHKWSPLPTGTAEARSHYVPNAGTYNMTPQDFNTIYNINPVLTAGTTGVGYTIGILGSGPFAYGTVSGGDAGGTATGGDVATFRTVFGITAPLNLLIQHGDANFPCTVSGGTDSTESALDTEWAGAVAPGANLIFENCSTGSTTGVQFYTEIAALIDANVADVITSSLGTSEQLYGPGDTSYLETEFSEAAAQGQTFVSAQGDSGSDDSDFEQSQGVSGLSVDYPGSSAYVLSVGGTDFQDTYDSVSGGLPQSTYWNATNTPYYGDARSYVPEMVWNESCASPFIAMTPEFGGAPGEPTSAFCNSGPNGGFGIGGGGGVSTLFPQPAWQTGIAGLSPSITQRTTPDVALFASSGEYWSHSIVACDSNVGFPCTSPGNFAFAGGTSFAAPQFAGILALVDSAKGSRQGLVQPALYAIARTQYTAGTACYANGQSANTGLSVGLPASSCVFHDVTTSSNNNECEVGTPNCYTDASANYGVFTSSGDVSVFVDAYAAGAGYDLATGLGSVNVTNLISDWSTSYSSSTSLSASPTAINTTQSTILTATVTGGTPSGVNGPALTGSIQFEGMGDATVLGGCTLSAGTCSATIQGSTLQTHALNMIAIYSGDTTYPSSTSAPVVVTVTEDHPVASTITSPAPGTTLSGSAVTFTWNHGTGAYNWQLLVGSKPGLHDYYGVNTYATTANATGIPTNGSTVYVRLISVINGAQSFVDSTYTAQGATLATMTSPTPGSQLTSTQPTFTWSAGIGVTAYQVYFGTTVGSNNLGGCGNTTATSCVPSKALPTDGSTVNVRLFSRVNNAWQTVDYTYTAKAATLATMISPAPGGSLPSATPTFTWTTGTGVTGYQVYFGTTVGSDNLAGCGATTSTSCTPSRALPTNGSTIYVRLYSRINNAWQTNDYTYTAHCSSCVAIVPKAPTQ